MRDTNMSIYAVTGAEGRLAVRLALALVGVVGIIRRSGG
jgi:hypothetical protein